MSKARQQSTSAQFPLCNQGVFQDTITGIEASSIPNTGILFVCSSWDKTCKSFMCKGVNQVDNLYELNVGEPVTALSPAINGSSFLIGTACGNIGLWNISQNQLTPIGKLNDAISSIKVIPEINSFCISSLDGNLGLLSTSDGKMNTMNVNNKIHCMDCKGSYIGYATSGRVEIFDLQAGKLMTDNLLGSRESNVHSSVQNMEFFKDGKGIMFGSNDGRVNIINFEYKMNSHTYAFKAQHKKIGNNQAHYFPVNAVNFYDNNVFLTAGSDGVINIWDRAKKSSVNTMESPIQNSIITTAKFVCGNQFLAYSIGYDWHKGVSGNTNNYQYLPIIKVVDQALVSSSM